MHFRILIAGMTLLGGVANASADQYYVIRDSATKHCTIVTEQPAERTVIRQIGPIAFASREEAESRIKQTQVCTSDDDDDDDDDATPPMIIQRR